MDYYFLSQNKVLTQSETEKLTGLQITDSTPDEALNRFGIYPVNTVPNPNPGVFYTAALTHNVNGTVADQVWTPNAIALADAVTQGGEILNQHVDRRLKRIRKCSKFSIRTLLGAASQLSGDRATRFGYWINRVQTIISELDTNITAVEGAANVDAINDIVTPAYGFIDIALDAANPTNLLACDYHSFLSKNYANSGTELHFPSTNTTVTYSAGFAATASVVTEADPTVQIRVTATGIVIDELCLKTEDSTKFAADSSSCRYGFNISGRDEVQEEEDARFVRAEPFGTSFSAY